MPNQYTITDIKQALTLADFDGMAAQQAMTPVPRAARRPQGKSGRVRLGGVLVLLYCYQDELCLVLTRRRDDLNTHAGQISFPGGQQENSESLQETAVREAHEEIGVKPSSLTILGDMTSLYIQPSDFEVHPTVAWFANGRRPNFVPCQDEVADILEVPLRRLFDPSTRGEETWTIRGYEVTVPFFNVDGYKVWGATAMMLNELVERLKSVSGKR